eukprot:3425163-Pyramimonas_sp.AAC.1
MKALLGGGLWPPARKFRHGLADSNLCQFCKQEIGTFGHHWHECEELWRQGDAPEAGPAMPEESFKRRQLLKDSARGTPPRL